MFHPVLIQVNLKNICQALPEQRKPCTLGDGILLEDAGRKIKMILNIISGMKKKKTTRKGTEVSECMRHFT